jgi:Uma2 family endonuclease
MTVAELVMKAESKIGRGQPERPRTDRSKRWRLADLDQFPEENGFRYEIIDGELIVTAAPARPHGVTAARLIETINQYIRDNQLDWSLMPQPINLELETDTQTVHCEPDLSLFDQPFETVLADDDLFPVVVIEIVSPGNPENDYLRKVEAYAALGIPEYWIVDPRHRVVTFLALRGEESHPRYERIPGDQSSLLAGLTFNTDELFAGIG